MAEVRTIAAALAAGIIGLSGVVVPGMSSGIARADDPRQDIKDLVNSERLSSKCGPLHYNDLLERDAQYGARNTGTDGSGDRSKWNVGGYPGKIQTLAGIGDPKATAMQQLNPVLRNAVQNCDVQDFAVDFYRAKIGVSGPFNDDVYRDWVTVVLGIPPPPPAQALPIPAAPPTPQRTGPPIKHLGKIPPPAESPGAPAPAKTQATVTNDVDVYDAPSATGNKVNGLFLHAGDKYDLIAPCTDNWCHLSIPAAPGGAGWVYQDGFLSVP